MLLQMITENFKSIWSHFINLRPLKRSKLCWYFHIYLIPKWFHVQLSVDVSKATNRWKLRSQIKKICVYLWCNKNISSLMRIVQQCAPSLHIRIFCYHFEDTRCKAQNLDLIARHVSTGAAYPSHTIIGFKWFAKMLGWNKLCCRAINAVFRNSKKGLYKLITFSIEMTHIVYC